MENTRQPIPLRIRQHLRDAVGRMHPSVSFVSCIGVLLAYLTGVYITGSLHEASRWMGAMLACTSLVVVLQSHNYKDSLRAGWTRVLGTFLGARRLHIPQDMALFDRRDARLGLRAGDALHAGRNLPEQPYRHHHAAHHPARLADDAPRLAGRKLPAALYRIGRRRGSGRCAAVGARTVETMARTAGACKHSYR